MEKIISKLLPLQASSQYVAQVLEVGGMSSILAARRCVSATPFNALVPDGISADKLLDFAHGGVLRAPPAVPHVGGVLVQRVPTTIPAATAIVLNEMQRLDQAVLLVHEPMLAEHELDCDNMPYEIIGGKIYLVSAQRADERSIATLIQYGLLSWHFLAFLVERNREFRSVDELVASSKMMLVGAYDGESFLYSIKP